MEYSVCVSSVFSGVPIPEAVARAKRAGATAFEFWSWWDQDLEAILAAQEKHHLRCDCMCTRMVPLTDPKERNAYLEGLHESIEAANDLHCSGLISQTGPELKRVPRLEQHASIVDGLRASLPMLEQHQMTLWVEPLNILVDHPGYYLTSSEEAFEIVREVGSPYVKVLFDVYHQQITEGNLIANLTKHVQDIGHIHIAGNPGRHDPLTDSEVDYCTVIRALQKAGYEGSVGLEYFPLGDPDESLRTFLMKAPVLQ